MDSSSLKVDATCLALDDSRWEVLFISNINIPVRYFNDATVINRVLNFVDSEYRNLQPSYEICGAYYLKHKATEEEKFWSGSFFSHRNTVSGRLPDLFRPYDRAGLEVQLWQLERIAASWAYLGGEDTAWEFHGAVSAIVNVNCRIAVDDLRLARRGLVQRIHDNGGGFSRRHVTFELPR
jgi:hypothetical protein